MKQIRLAIQLRQKKKYSMKRVIVTVFTVADAVVGPDYLNVLHTPCLGGTF